MSIQNYIIFFNFDQVTANNFILQIYLHFNNRFIKYAFYICFHYCPIKIQESSLKYLKFS